MENLFDTVVDTDKEKQIAEQKEFIMKEVANLKKDEVITLNFAILSELRSILYKKGYTVRVHGKESTLSLRDPREDMNDEWTTFDCGN